ncbi:hypoxanthine phosphoribosyltransferase [Candidatus Binatia bacterium]|nr:hypoxanthine phosphoribosyltransferase [Candidatus Binatia bacterium]
MVKHSVLLDAATIATRVAGVARAVRSETEGSALTVIGLLTGSFVFVADLVRALSLEGVETWIDFMAVSHYGTPARASDTVQIRKDLSIDIRGHHVLLVDDILDTGLTLRYARDRVSSLAPASLRTCVLLDKPDRRLVPIEADYVAFAIPDRWAIGYGLDLDGQGRGLPYVGAVDDSSPKGAKRGNT